MSFGRSVQFGELIYFWFSIFELFTECNEPDEQSIIMVDPSSAIDTSSPSRRLLYKYGL
jgi:hypothetical protein